MGQGRCFIPKNLLKFEYEGVQVNYPEDVYALYFSGMAPKYIRRIIDKWERGRELSDRDYFQLLKKVFAHPHRWRDLPDTDDLMALCGLTLAEGHLYIREEARHDVEVKALRCFIEHLLQPDTQQILERYFPDQEINLEIWHDRMDEQLELDQTVKIAYIFTLYNYLWQEDCVAKYSFFLEYYRQEFDKRIGFVKQLWEHRQPGEGLEYIPIFEDIRNLNPEKGAFVLQVINRILKSENVHERERKIIERTLIEHAKKLLSCSDEWASAIKDELLTPLVSEVVSLNKSREFIRAARLCLDQQFYNSAINRGYYAMLRAARAALVSCGYARPWRDANLRPVETHEEVISNFYRILVAQQNLLPERYYYNLRKVYHCRLLADYADDEMEEMKAREIIGLAQKFVDRIDQLVKKPLEQFN